MKSHVQLVRSSRKRANRTTNMRPHTFKMLLGQIMTEQQVSIRTLAANSGVSRRTLENWLSGHVERPRYWQGIVQVAAALKLSTQQTDQLLRLANHPTVATLLMRTKRIQDRKLLASWRSIPNWLTTQVDFDRYIVHLQTLSADATVDIDVERKRLSSLWQQMERGEKTF